MGTAEGGSATTYLYEVVNPAAITTTNEVAFTTIATKSTDTRTIVASASGYVELLPDSEATIACNFINSSFGQCVDTQTSVVTANSGAPTPIVLQVDTTSTFLSDPPLSVSTQTPPTSEVSSVTPSPTQANDQATTRRPTTVATIVGGGVGGTVALLALVALFLFWRRRRLRRSEREYLPHSYDVASPTLVPETRSQQQPYSANARRKGEIAGITGLIWAPNPPVYAA
ncbi:hypothetical protein B0H19DRAFT_1381028 [Mycena capillaripes]|nr:hypothetical protein B0H19DRAFT_1381028 [Mycena capillaripes]